MADDGVTPLEAAARAIKQVADDFGLDEILIPQITEAIVRAALSAAIESLPKGTASGPEVLGPYFVDEKGHYWPVPWVALRRAFGLGDQEP